MTTEEKRLALKRLQIEAMQSELGASPAVGNTPAPIAPSQSAGEAFAANLLPGMTFGFADEAAAGIGSLFEDRSYDEILQGLRAQTAKQMNEHPVASIAGQVVGGIAGQGVGGAKAIATARTLPGMIATGAATGAGFGALQSFGDGVGGFANRATDAVGGAAIGLGLGGLIPGLGAGAKHVWSSVNDMVRNAKIGGTVGKGLGVSNKTGRVLANVIGQDDPSMLQQALTRGGPNAMLADASPQATGMLDMVMRSPVPAARTAGRAVEGRATQAHQDITAAMDGAMGGPVGLDAAQDAIRTGTASARQSAYGDAYSKPIDYSAPAGMKLLDELTPRIPPEAINYANKLMRNNGEKSAQIMASIGDDGVTKFTNPPDVRQWDYIKQGIDMLAESGDGQGALGKQTRMGASYEKLAREVRNAVGDAVPEYNTARAVAADAIDRRKAVDFGATILQLGTTRENVKDAVSKAKVAGVDVSDELTAMRQGLRSQIDETLANVRAVASDQNVDARAASKAFSDLSSPAAREKMALVLGDAWPKLQEQLDQAGVALGLRARTSANSATFGRGAAEQAVKDEAAPNFLQTGNPFRMASDVGKMATGGSPDAVRRMTDSIKGELADVLTRQGDPSNIVKMIEAALVKSPQNPNSGSIVRKLLETMLMGTTGTASGGLQNLTQPRN